MSDTDSLTPLPDPVADNQYPLRMVGAGELRWLGFPIYDASLWTSSGRHAGFTAGDTVALSLWYRRSFTRDQLLQSTIVLTGGLGDRAEEEAFLRSLGITVRGSVSRKTSLLVACDPSTLSGKATKARDLGVPIMDAATFWGILGGT